LPWGNGGKTVARPHPRCIGMRTLQGNRLWMTVSCQPTIGNHRRDHHPKPRYPAHYRSSHFPCHLPPLFIADEYRHGERGKDVTEGYAALSALAADGDRFSSKQVTVVVCDSVGRQCHPGIGPDFWP
jgi:hypothetical protein